MCARQGQGQGHVYYGGTLSIVKAQEYTVLVRVLLRVMHVNPRRIVVQ